jgi:histidyl-tRNA synthetase
MLRGTRIIESAEARLFSDTIAKFKDVMYRAGYGEVIIPTVWEQETFTEKAGKEILDQMYTFQDKKQRDICLIPEVTAIIQKQYKEQWCRNKPKPHKIFYVSRCYRYERPQAGRYREFWQFGVELLGGKSPDDSSEVLCILQTLLDTAGVKYEVKSSVKRGLDYYIEDGFEAECSVLGAQKQIAGGGRYDCGIGFAIGLDRLILSMEKNK